MLSKGEPPRDRARERGPERSREGRGWSGPCFHPTTPGHILTPVLHKSSLLSHIRMANKQPRTVAIGLPLGRGRGCQSRCGEGLCTLHLFCCRLTGRYFFFVPHGCSARLPAHIPVVCCFCPDPKINQSLFIPLCQLVVSPRLGFYRYFAVSSCGD